MIEPLAGDEVHVLLARPEAIAPGSLLRLAGSWLAAGERERLERIRIEDTRTQFALAHVLLRGLLSRYAAVGPADWVFATGPHGRPEIAAPLEWAGRIRFNLSHTRGLVACGLTRGRDLGVDVERSDRVAHVCGVARRFFAPAEAGFVLAAAEPERRRRFFELWTLKEAYIKARGLGLSLSLQSFAFQVDAKGARLLRTPPDDEPAAWQFDLAHRESGHVLAVAVRVTPGERLRVSVRDCDPGVWS
jgi:4'-phosphopantetheinyl transferase